MTDQDWHKRASALVDELIDTGDLRNKAWVGAFTDTPRHLFTPQVTTTTADGYRELCGDDPADQDEWLSLIYSDESLVTQTRAHAAGYTRPSGAALRVPTSSSTMPSLMVRMLEVLNVDDGHRVLEIGTGTGYNAALLCHRLGAANVVSIDLDPELVDHARRRLSTLGYQPTLIAGDGAEGTDSHGPFDRIIATAAVPAIPLAWITQLKPGGKILANVRGELAGGALCLLTKDSTDDEVIGPVLPIGGHFMWLRPEANNPHRPHEHHRVPARGTRSRTSTQLDPAAIPVDEVGFRFLLQLQLRGVRALDRGQVSDPTVRDGHPAIIVDAFDGSRAEAFVTPGPDGAYRVIQSGPRRIWDTVQATARLYRDLGEPGPGRFGVVANPSTQFVWFDHDDNWYRWPLPLT